MQERNKTKLCLLIVALFACFFFARSVQVREGWIVPTFLSDRSPHQDGSSMQLAWANNWLKEGPFHLRFSTYMYPPSIETPTLDKRGFYGSIPSGSVLPVYLFFKVLDLTGIVSDIYEKRGTQLLLMIYYNFTLHFLMVLVLCWIAFFVCRNLGFDHLNSTLLALIPAIVQFHNANSLYWHTHTYFHRHAIMLPFVLYMFMQSLRIVRTTSPRVLRIVQVLQPLLMFYGVLTDWLFVFVILTVYIIRIIRKEIKPPLSLQHVMCWARQSFLFFAPALVAIALWTYQIAYYLRSVVHSKLFDTALSGHRFTMMDNLLHRIGIANGIDHIIHYLKTSLYTYMRYGYGLTGLLMLYAVFYMATRGRKFMSRETGTANLAATVYLMLFVPCLAHFLFFMEDNAAHPYSSMLFSPALSLSFAFAPIFVLQMLKKNIFYSALQIMNKKSITLVALLGLGSSILYGYTQIYNEQSVTKMFSPPAHGHLVIGNFIRKNTEYRDVVFSKDYYLTEPWLLMYTHFPNKVIHFAYNLDHVYRKTKMVEQDFTVKIFYLVKRKHEIEKLTAFLKSHNISVDDIQEKGIGGLLAFNGKQFRTWYERVHECGAYPQHCAVEDFCAKMEMRDGRVGRRLDIAIEVWLQCK